MCNRSERLGSAGSATGLAVLLAVVTIISCASAGAAQGFSVPDDVALRIRLDDTLTSVDSQVGDPFSATVMDKGDYQNARVHGHIAQTARASNARS